MFFLRRLVATLPVLLIVAFGVFLLLHLSPGDPAVAILGVDATAEELEAVRERLGLNDPFVVQFGVWASQTLRGDLGTSLFSSQAVTDAIKPRLPITLSLTLGAVLVALLIAIPSGIFAATRPNTRADRAVMLGASLGISMPNFLVGFLLIHFVSLRLGWLPASGYVAFGVDPTLWLRHMILPSVTLGVAVAAELSRHLRGSMRDVLHQDYIRTAEAKGLSRLSVVAKHALKNASIPVVTVLGLQVRALLGGTIVVEQVFGIPGFGTLAVQSVFNRNFPLVQGIALTAVVIVLVTNLIVDMSYAWLNPRIRQSG